MSKEKLAIFDMDGTLFDTARANYQAYLTALEQVGRPWNLTFERFQKDCFGKNYRDFLYDSLGLDGAEAEEVHRRKQELYPAFLRAYGRKNTGLFDIMDGIGQRYYLALATTASRKNTMDALTHFSCVDRFDLIVTGEDVTRRKPDPEVFLRIQNQFGIPPEHTVLFEDHPDYAMAARELGFAVYQVLGF